MELWSLMDINRNFNGRIIERGQIIDPGCFHLVVFAFIKNHDGQYLISQRASNKTHAHTWEIPAGSSILEEDSLSAILREVKEEVGLVLEPKNGEIIKTFYRQGDSAYIGDIWLFNQTVDDSEIICGLNEVQKAKFADKQEIIELMRSELFMVGMNEVLECIELL